MYCLQHFSLYHANSDFKHQLLIINVLTFELLRIFVFSNILGLHSFCYRFTKSKYVMMSVCVWVKLTLPFPNFRIPIHLWSLFSSDKPVFSCPFFFELLVASRLDVSVTLLAVDGIGSVVSWGTSNGLLADWRVSVSGIPLPSNDPLGTDPACVCSADGSWARSVQHGPMTSNGQIFFLFFFLYVFRPICRWACVVVLRL